MTASNGDGGSVKDFYEDEKHLMKLCDFLRSSEGPPVREAVEMDKRVYYIKGAKNNVWTHSDGIYFGGTNENISLSFCLDIVIHDFIDILKLTFLHLRTIYCILFITHNS